MSGLNTRRWTAYLLFFDQHLAGDPKGRPLMRAEGQRLAPTLVGRQPNQSEVTLKRHQPKRWS